MSTHSMTRHRRVVPHAAILFAAAAVFTLSCSVAPLPAGATTTTTPTTAPGLHEALNGVTVGPAVVTTPGKPTRQLTADQNTAFMQTWLGASVVTHIPHERPPSCLPISKMRSSATSQRVTLPMVVYYATDGVTAWVGMPKQTLSFGSVTAETWIRSPESPTTIAAFGGDVASVDLASGTPPSAPADPTATTVVCPGAKTTTSGPRTTAAAESSSSSSTWVWFVIPAVIVVAGLGVWLFTRRRSRTA